MERLTQDKQEEIARRIREEVGLSGSAGIGDHAEQVLGQSPVPASIIQQIEAAITASGKYISKAAPAATGDFIILKNPRSEKETPEINRLKTTLKAQLVDLSKLKRERNIAILVSIILIITNIFFAIMSVIPK